MKKVLVTGGAGFIGSHIVEEFLNNNYSVIVLDDFSTGKKENLPDDENLEIVEGSVTDKKLVDELVSKVDLISHQAAIVSVPDTIEEPLRSHEVSVDGTLNIFESARKNDVKKIVVASSAAVYGNCSNLPVEESETCMPESPYALHKKTIEEYAKLYNNLYDMDIVALRYFNVFGPRQALSGGYPAVIPIFIKKLLNDEGLIIYGDGDQTRDFVYVKDVARANRLSLEKDLEEKIINIGCGKEIPLNELTSVLSDILGKTPEIKHEESRKGDIYKSVCNNDLMAKNLGFTPQTNFKEALENTIDFYK